MLLALFTNGKNIDIKEEEVKTLPNPYIFIYFLMVKLNKESQSCNSFLNQCLNVQVKGGVSPHRNVPLESKCPGLPKEGLP